MVPTTAWCSWPTRCGRAASTSSPSAPTTSSRAGEKTPTSWRCSALSTSPSEAAIPNPSPPSPPKPPPPNPADPPVHTRRGVLIREVWARGVSALCSPRPGPRRPIALPRDLSAAARALANLGTPRGTSSGRGWGPGGGEGCLDPFPPSARRTRRAQMEPSHPGAAHACRVVAGTPPPPPAPPPHPAPSPAPIGRSRQDERWRHGRPSRKQDPNGSTTTSVGEPGRLGLGRGLAHQALARLLAGGLVVLPGAELARDRLLVRKHEGGEARLEELGLHEVFRDEASGPVAIDRAVPEPALERRFAAGPDADGDPRGIDRGRLALDADPAGFLEHQERVDVPIDVGSLDRRGRRREAQHAERPRHRHIARRDRSRAGSSQQRVDRLARREKDLKQDDENRGRREARPAELARREPPARIRT